MVSARLCFFVSSDPQPYFLQFHGHQEGTLSEVTGQYFRMETHINHKEYLAVELAHLHVTAEERWKGGRSCPFSSILNLRFD